MRTGARTDQAEQPIKQVPSCPSLEHCPNKSHGLLQTKVLGKPETSALGAEGVFGKSVVHAL